MWRKKKERVQECGLSSQMHFLARELRHRTGRVGMDAKHPKLCQSGLLLLWLAGNRRALVPWISPAFLRFFKVRGSARFRLCQFHVPHVDKWNIESGAVAKIYMYEWSGCEIRVDRLAAARSCAIYGLHGVRYIYSVSTYDHRHSRSSQLLRTSQRCHPYSLIGMDSVVATTPLTSIHSSICLCSSPTHTRSQKPKL